MNENTITYNGKQYDAWELVDWEDRQHLPRPFGTTLCYLCVREHEGNCAEIQCEATKRTDNREVVFPMSFEHGAEMMLAGWLKGKV